MLFFSSLLSRRAIPVIALSLFGSSLASAVTVLNFEGINNPVNTTTYAAVQSFYNGGTSSVGTSGTNFGIEFTSNALAICLTTSTTVGCSNTSRGGLAPGTEFGGLFFLTGAQTFMNVAAGFDTGFSFNYASATDPGSVSVFDGLNGTGNLLATINLSPNAAGCPASPFAAAFCPFAPVGVSFVGTARSVSFAGVANQIVFDDITFGSVTVGGVPEPSTWALMGAALAALYGKRRHSANRH